MVAIAKSHTTTTYREFHDPDAIRLMRSRQYLLVEWRQVPELDDDQRRLASAARLPPDEDLALIATETEPVK